LRGPGSGTRLGSYMEPQITQNTQSAAERSQDQLREFTRKGIWRFAQT